MLPQCIPRAHSTTAGYATWRLPPKRGYTTITCSLQKMPTQNVSSAVSGSKTMRYMQRHVFLIALCCDFSLSNLYFQHRQTSHPEPPRPVSPPASYRCTFCDKVFKLQSGLDDHTAAKHSCTCGMCDFICPAEEILQEHITSAHSCPVCHEGVFANVDLLNEHLEDHTAPYRCEVCQTRYAEEEGLRQHYKDSPDDTHPSCTRCDLGFRDAGEYHNVLSPFS
jgi:exonuclease III